MSEYAAAYFAFPNSDTKKNRKEIRNSITKHKLQADILLLRIANNLDSNIFVHIY
jgi:hypothetical protein